MMRKLTTSALALVATGAALAQFADGKTYVPAQPSNVSTIISTTNLTTTVPAYGASPSLTTGLEGMYGADLLTPGANKATTCVSSPTPGHAYLKQECNAMNYVRGNKATRMHFTIDTVTEPAIVNGNNTISFPASQTTGTPNLSGAYSACTTSTTPPPPPIVSKERCEIGNEVIEGACTIPLIVDVTWDIFNFQGNADLSLGYCPAANFRGDQTVYPQNSSYITTPVSCAAYGLGTGVGTITQKKECDNTLTTVGWNSASCQTPLDPAIKIASTATEVCHSQPTTNYNCFNAARQFTTRTTVPLISEYKDYAACGLFNTYQATIK